MTDGVHLSDWPFAPKKHRLVVCHFYSRFEKKNNSTRLGNFDEPFLVLIHEFITRLKPSLEMPSVCDPHHTCRTPNATRSVAMGELKHGILDRVVDVIWTPTHRRDIPMLFEFIAIAFIVAYAALVVLGHVLLVSAIYKCARDDRPKGKFVQTIAEIGTGCRLSIRRATIAASALMNPYKRA